MFLAFKLIKNKNIKLKSFVSLYIWHRTATAFRGDQTSVGSALLRGRVNVVFNYSLF